MCIGIINQWFHRVFIAIQPQDLRKALDVLPPRIADLVATSDEEPSVRAGAAQPDGTRPGAAVKGDGVARAGAEGRVVAPAPVGNGGACIQEFFVLCLSHNFAFLTVPRGSVEQNSLE